MTEAPAVPAAKSAEEVAAIACAMRCDIVEMLAAAGSGHPGGSLSCVEMLAALFFAGVMRYNPADPADPARDRFVLSKGHAAPTYYAVAHQLGWLRDDELPTLRKLGSRLQGHIDSNVCPGVEACSGSLGQGLAIACGLALGFRWDAAAVGGDVAATGVAASGPGAAAGGPGVAAAGCDAAAGGVAAAGPGAAAANGGVDAAAAAGPGVAAAGCDAAAGAAAGGNVAAAGDSAAGGYTTLTGAARLRQVFCVCGDGEMQEGSNWESLMFAAHHGLTNVTLFVDLNNLQIDGHVTDVCSLGDIDAKLAAFGWRVLRVNGHDVAAIAKAARAAVADASAPYAIVCETVKGKGVSFMEDRVDWHGVAPNAEQAAAALAELAAQAAAVAGGSGLAAVAGEVAAGEVDAAAGEGLASVGEMPAAQAVPAPAARPLSTIAATRSAAAAVSPVSSAYAYAHAAKEA